MPERIEVDAGMAELIREALRLQEFYPALPPEFVLIYSDVQRVIKANPKLGDHLISLAKTRLGK